MHTKMQMCMSVLMQLDKSVNIKKLHFDIGKFRIENAKGIIPFDFDTKTTRVHKMTNTLYRVDYASSTVLTDSYDEVYRQLGLSESDITARFFAAATDIVDFQFKLMNKREKEIPCRYSVEDIVFFDEHMNRFNIRKDTLKQFNLK